MNGTTMLRPAGRDSLYLPKRSRMPARACGMIRTVRASMMTTNSTIRISRAYTTSMAAPSLGGAGSGHQLADRMDVRRGAADREHLDRRPRGDRERVVVGTGRPDLAGQLDPSWGMGGELLGHDALLADQLVHAADEVGALVE